MSGDFWREPGDHFDALSRRGFLLACSQGLASTLATPSWAASAPSQATDFWKAPRTIRLKHVSGEQIESTYWSDGQVILEEYARLSWFMRDRVVNSAVYMNPVLLDIAYGVCGWMKYFDLRDPIILTSGHRDRLRNATIEGASRNSLHITGDALDISIPSISNLQVARFGVWLGGGGVGWYPGKDFTHLDRGRLRAWKG